MEKSMSSSMKLTSAQIIVTPPGSQAKNLSALKAGFWSASFGAVLGIIYMLLLAILQFSRAGFPPPEPYQSLIGTVILITAPTLLVLMTAIHYYADEGQRVFSLSAFAFMILFAAMTSINRFVALTVVRQSVLAGDGAGLELILPYHWPSVMLSLEIMGWGFFLGLAFIAVAPVFHGGKLERWIFWTFLISGLLCFVSGFGIVLNVQSLIMVGILAWGPGLTLAAILVAILFHRLQQAYID